MGKKGGRKRLSYYRSDINNPLFYKNLYVQFKHLHKDRESFMVLATGIVGQIRRVIAILQYEKLCKSKRQRQSIGARI